MHKASLNRHKFWKSIIGSPKLFPLESRIFHNISAIALIILTVQILFNVLNGLYHAALISSIIAIIQLLLYYLSRFKNRLNLAVTISAIEINITTAIVYFYNSGINSGILLLFAVSLFMVILVVPRKQWLLWFLANLVIVSLIVYLEYHYPNVIQERYANRKALFIDIFGTYVIVITLIYLCTIQVRKSYHAQKLATDEKALNLQLLNDEKDKLFSIISHDLTAPLTSVKQYFDLLTEVDLNTEDRKKIEQDLIRSVGHTQDLLSNLLQWAKSQMQHIDMHLENIRLKDLIKPAIAVFLPIAKKKSISLTIEVDEQIEVTADHNMLQIVIRNLLNNAIKFTKERGHVELKADIQGLRCIISIKDNGIGIPQDKQSKIFSLNVGITYGTVNEKGTGLGLRLSKDYTILQGGEIWFTSEPLKGTVFYVSLPGKRSTVAKTVLAD